MNRHRRFLAIATAGLALAVTAGAQKIYWPDTLGQVLRSNLDGSNAQVLVTGLASPVGMAVDAVAGKMYWTEFNGQIKRANLDGSNVQPLLVANMRGTGIALDPAGGKMYWTEQGANGIHRANLDGSNGEDLVTTGLSSPAGIELDLGAGKMYWADSGAGRLQRANLDGSSLETIRTGLAYPVDIALDLTAGKVYWVDNALNVIQRSNLDGSGLETPVPIGSVAPIGLAIDPEAGKMYWSECGANGLRRANLDGTGIQHLPSGGFCAQFLDLGPAAPSNPWTDLGNGLAGGAGVPNLTGFGTLQAGTYMSIRLTGAAAGAAATHAAGPVRFDVPVFGGTLVPRPDFLIPMVTSAAGGDVRHFLLNSGVPPGTPIYFQTWVLDTGGPAGLAASNALQAMR